LIYSEISSELNKLGWICEVKSTRKFRCIHIKKTNHVLYVHNNEIFVVCAKSIPPLKNIIDMSIPGSDIILKIDNILKL
jgi:hypothetical protein